MSIDLGFAYTDLGNGSVSGFIDVPGHERFVRNMLAGVSGIDYAILIVAADDGPMPQTEEHLAILDMLGVEAGCIALLPRSTGSIRNASKKRKNLFTSWSTARRWKAPRYFRSPA